MNVLELLFSAKGRIRRRTYWTYSIGYGIGIWIIYYVLYLFLGEGSFMEDIGHFARVSPTPFHLAMIILMGASLWPSICISAKRWHDRNRSGWIAGATTIFSTLAAYVPPIVTAAHVENAQPITLVASIASFGVGIWVLVECGFLDGTPGPNRFGPSPKGLGKTLIAEAFN
jgi:uncharacterized membrane protein YhaH (DUF805 family)